MSGYHDLTEEFLSLKRNRLQLLKELYDQATKSHQYSAAVQVIKLARLEVEAIQVVVDGEVLSSADLDKRLAEMTVQLSEAIEVPTN